MLRVGFASGLGVRSSGALAAGGGTLFTRCPTSQVHSSAILMSKSKRKGSGQEIKFSADERVDRILRKRSRPGSRFLVSKETRDEPSHSTYPAAHCFACGVSPATLVHPGALQAGLRPLTLGHPVAFASTHQAEGVQLYSLPLLQRG